MPIVGSKHFAYGPKGMKDAKKAAAKTGKRMISKPPAKKRY